MIAGMKNCRNPWERKRSSSAETFWPKIGRGLDQSDAHLDNAEHVHGSDGLGEIDLPEPDDVQIMDYIELYEALIDAHGESLVVIAIGPLTNLAAILESRPGLLQRAGRVIVSGADTAKLTLAQKLGAQAVVDVRETDVVSFILDHTRGLGVDYAVEASGHPDALQHCLQATRQGGTIAVVGIYEHPVEKLDLGLAVVRDLTLCCSVASPNAFEPTLRLMAAGKIQVLPMVTQVLPLADAAEALEIQQTQTDRRIKIHLQPPEGE